MLTDRDIRQVLLDDLQRSYAGEADTRVIEELGLCRGQARIDVAVVNGLVHGFEIKSDRDSLRRLRGQVIFYGKVVDQATLVLGERHITKARRLVPSWWGICRVRTTSDGLQIASIRRARKNPSRDRRALAELLWQEHAIALLATRNLDRGFRKKPRRIIWDRISQHFTTNEVAENVRQRLTERAVPLFPPRLSSDGGSFPAGATLQGNQTPPRRPPQP